MMIYLNLVIGIKLKEYPTQEETVLILLERINEAQRIATRELKEMLVSGGGNRNKKNRNKNDIDDDEKDNDDLENMRSKKKKKKQH